jgi:FkbM family methyltransferase
MTTTRPTWVLQNGSENAVPSISLRMRARLLRLIGRQTWLPRGRSRAVNMIWHPESGWNFPFEIDYFGLRYRGNLCNFNDWMVYTFGASSYEEMTILASLASELRKRRRTITFFDIGANVGEHSLFISRLADQIIAFEPFPSLQTRFEEKIVINHINNVRLIPCALGVADEMRYYHPGGGTNSGAGTFIPEAHATYGDPVPIQVRNGDHLFSELNLPAIDLMKIDVEGFEPFVFQGLAKQLRRDRPPILMELSERSRAGFGSEDAFRSTFWEGAVFAEVNARRTGLPYQLRPFDYKKSQECLVVPPEMADFVLRQISG